MLVMKFGGTSVGDAQCFRKVKDIVAAAARDHWPVAVVVSAMSTVTQSILDATRHAAAGDQEGMEKKLAYLEYKHRTTVQELLSGPEREATTAAVNEILSELRRTCEGMGMLRELPLRSMDAALSAGERLSATILAPYLASQGLPAQAVDASRCVVSDDNFGSARPLMEPTRTATRRVLLPLLERKVIPVVTGFLAATVDGVRTTLGRGASDYSGALMAASLDADELWIWTDVDGVLSADPKMVGEAVILDELTYEEAAELSHFGAKVLHHETLAPLVARKIPVWIKNTFSPSKPGSRIGPSHPASTQGPKAVTSLAPVAMLTLRSKGTPGATELLARTFGALAHSQIDILMVTQSSYQDSFCLLVPQLMSDRAVSELEQAFRLEWNHQYLDPLERQDVTAVALIGEGMRGIPGIAAKMFGALARHKINIIAIAQGSSESNISLIVSLEDRAAAVRAIHQECVGAQPAAARV